MTWKMLKAEPASDTTLVQLERAARGALEAATGRGSSELDWQRATEMLLEFVTILREWDELINTTALQTGNVVTMPETTPTSESGLDKAA
jgi:hypothetical protein